MKLSILIPTLNEPRYIQGLRRLRAVLDPQVEKYPGQVEVKINDQGRSVPTGTKRNEMIKNCDSDYFTFIDSDDLVTKDYLDWIMKALESSPDVVTYCGWMTNNGVGRVDWVIKLGEKYEERGGKYYRFPNHLSVFKRELVKNIKFPPVWQGEDYAYAKMIHDRGILKTEVHIDKMIYHYDKIHEVLAHIPRRR